MDSADPDISAGLSVDFTADVNTDAYDVCELTDSKFAVVYTDDVSNDGQVKIGTVAGDVISYGSAYEFDDDENWHLAAESINSTHFVIAYSSGGTGYAVVGRNTGGYIVDFGTPTNFSLTSGWYQIDNLDDSHVVIAYEDTINDTGYAIVGEVAGQTITFGERKQFGNSPIGYEFLLTTMDSETFVIGHDNGTQTLTATYGKVSGTEITEWGADAEVDGKDTYYKSIDAFNSTHFIMVTHDKFARVGKIAGTSIEFGANSSWESGATQGFHNINVKTLGIRNAVVLYSNLDDDITVRICNISGLTITGWREATVVEPATYGSIPQTALLSYNKWINIRQDGWLHGSSMIIEWAGTPVLSEPPVLNSFNVDDEPGATAAGWDLDNNDLQVDYSFYDPTGENCSLLWTFSLGGVPDNPTNTSYHGRRDNRQNETVNDFDLDWSSGVWEDYAGVVTVKMIAYDGLEYSNVLSDTLSNGIDGSKPVSSVNIIKYWENSDRSIIVSASDPFSDVGNVELFYAYSDDNVSFGSYISYGNDSVFPFVFTFTHPNSSGYYRLYSRATDAVGNVEDAPGVFDLGVGFDPYAPVTSVDAHDLNCNEDIDVTISVVENLSAIDDVRLYYRYSYSNTTFSGNTLFLVDYSSPYNYTFNFPNGFGYYWLSSSGFDTAGNLEDLPVVDGDILVFYNASHGFTQPQDVIADNLGVGIGDIVLLILTCSLVIIGAFDIRIAAMFATLLYAVAFILFYEVTAAGYSGFDPGRAGILVVVSIVILALLVLASGKSQYRYGYVP